MESTNARHTAGSRPTPESKRRRAHAALAGTALLMLVACEDPAKGKSKAVTTEATPTSQATPISAAPAAGSTNRYELDAASSKVLWTGSKVTGKHEGGFRAFLGGVDLVDHNPEKSAVTVEIEADSLFTDNDKLAGHLKSADFFDVARFPKVTFASTSIKAGGDRGASHTVTGNLTLHGVTKSIGFPASIRTTPAGVDVDAEFAINRKDFGLVYAGKPDDLIRDDVLIKLVIRSQKKS
jgi:polyisoprenoid-binding protein YceI